MRHAVVWIGVVLSVGFGAQEASAFSVRQSQYPNGNCDHCHLIPGGVRTEFGNQVGRTLSGGSVNWRALFRLDADGDGFTNGEELGDPAGTWMRGDADPRLLSEPHQEGSVPIPVGSPPEAQGIMLSLQEDEPFEGTLPFDDPDMGDAFYVRVVEGPELGELSFEDRGTGQVVYTPPPDGSGQDSFSYRVFDGSNLSEVAQVLINIEPVNDPPVFEAPLMPQTIREGSRLSFVVLVNDVEDGPLQAQAGALPEGATYEPEDGRFVWTPASDQAGEYTVRFVALDQEGVETTLDVEIRVRNNNATPMVGQIEGPTELNEGESGQWTLEASDADGDPLTWTWRFDDDADNPQEGQGLDQIERTFEDDGRLTLEVEVSDGFEVVRRQLRVDVANISPTVDAGENVTTRPGQEVNFEGSFTDPADEGAHTIAWDFGDGSAPVEGQLAVTHIYDAPGVFMASFTVSDGSARVADVVTVTVEGEGGSEEMEPEEMDPEMMACMPGQEVVCLCDGGGLGRAQCGPDAVAGECVCGGGGGQNADDGGCQSAPGNALGGSWGLFALMLGLWGYRRRRDVSLPT